MAGSNIRKQILLFFSLLFFVLSLRNVLAEEIVYTNPQTGYEAVVDDRKDLLAEAQEKVLLQQMRELTEYGNCMFVTCSDERDPSEHAKQIYRQRYGQESGTILIIDMHHRIIYIRNEGEVSRIITNAYSNAITDNSYTYASAGNYYECASSIFSQEKTLLEGGKIAQPMKYITNFLLSVLTALLIHFVILTVSRYATDPDPVRKSETIAAAAGVSVGILASELIESKSYHITPESDFTSYSGGSSGSSGSSYSSSSSGSSGSSSGSGGGHRF